MSQTTKELKNEIKKSLGLMRTLRDEVRVKLHLAGMDAKDEWNRLEPRITAVEAEVEAQVERAADEISTEVTEATRTALSEAIQRLSKLRSALS